MTTQERAKKVFEILLKEFPEVNTPLTHTNAFNLLVAVALSAQTLDATVNKVTPNLWAKYPTMEALSKANPKDVGEIIRIVNFHNNKAKNIVNLSKTLIEKFNGVVPHTIDELTTLPGVGRKTANVLISAWFVKRSEQTPPGSTSHPPQGGNSKIKGEVIIPEGVVVDTHVKRVAYRLGLTKETEPEKVEQDLMKLFKRSDWDEISLRLIFHGRKVCKAPTPLCSQCPLKDICPRIGIRKLIS